MNKQIILFTDGACLGNPGAGGWAGILCYNNHKKIISGGEPNTTNNRMELTAAIAALKALKEPCRIALTTDSTYVKDGITKWLSNWKRNGWKTAAKKPVKNEDLWKRLDTVREKHQVVWKWVKGHAGQPENELADELARSGMEPFKAK